MQWRIDSNTVSSTCIEGTFDDAISVAQQRCKDLHASSMVWLLPADIRLAQISPSGQVHLRRELSGAEIRRLMRRGHKTIAVLSFQMGITQKRIRAIRKHGFDDANLIRDWIEAIMAADIGPLPVKYRIRRFLEEVTCGNCGCPLYTSDYAYEFADRIFCSVICCRKNCGFGEEVVR